MAESGGERLSNWGRWGADDERGALNLLTPALVKQAAGLVKTGKVYSLSMPLEAEGPQWPQRHKTWRVTTFRNPPNERGSADDVMTLHSHSGTHMDALCHIWYDNQLYNGYNAAEHVTSSGATRNAIDRVPAIVGRGLLLDLAGWKGVEHLELGEAITAGDLDACVAAQGVTVQPGDLLLLRTGWMRVFVRDRALYDSGEPGIDESTIPWLKAHDIVAVGADNQAVEVLTEIPPSRLPVHAAAIRDLGIYLVENLNLDALAADRVYESLLVIAPLQLTGAIGSPVNPIAIG
ncbi:MAG: cyclase family protein [Caldilineaceae bacterium]|nr:cyclase family protein [Caldilineaceae bacterium]